MRAFVCVYVCLVVRLVFGFLVRRWLSEVLGWNLSDRERRGRR